MKRLFLLLLCGVMACEERPGVVAPPLMPDFTSMDINAVSMSIYHLTHTDAKGTILKTDTIGFFCAPFKVMPGTENEQTFSAWQSVGKRDSQLVTKGLLDGEGIQANDTSLFMHPHRDGYYKTLECCPFPYFEKVPIGGTYSWLLAIGAHWGSELYPIKDVDTFKTVFRFADTVTVHTPIYKGLCYHYTADTRSAYGTSHASWYLANHLGIVRFSITNTDSSVFAYEMAAHTCNADSMIFNKEFCYLLQRNWFPLKAN